MLFDTSTPFFSSSMPEKNHTHSQSRSRSTVNLSSMPRIPPPGVPLRIAITGSAGLVGSAVTKLALDEGHEVVALDILPSDNIRTHLPAELEKAKGRYTYHQVSALEFDRYKDAVRGCTGIVHLAMIPNGPDVDGRGDGTSDAGQAQHDVHNANVAMSYNTLSIATKLGINRIVLASSINAVGMLFSRRPAFNYLPIDEKHPCRPEDAYSLSKYMTELQGDAFVRRYPSMRIACLRFHGVVRDDQVSPEGLEKFGDSWKDLWGWVSASAVARSCLLSLTAPTSTFPAGTNESFFIVGPTITQRTSTLRLVEDRYPEIVKNGGIRVKLEGNQGLFDCGKAKRMLGWTENGFEWPESRHDSH
ncbi:hypothetical protein I316_03109 [Kwoniella heveanensis BCC8398]|uniref:NAD-dependent epimerase/dehydratase domain-containing protein n=1 Tax=Kwoniella heveanensis BCC8398 TaxID=1296120 RepID=A0A1B9GVN0_9TREE|nr:hypothetical protein I316_03109 [Kwoniella heveanensis BCC8398]